MPHVVLEFSNNISEKKHLPELLKQCQQILVPHLPTQLASCKSRTIEYNCFLVGDGHPKNAFVHLSIKILAGRTEETLYKIGSFLMTLLKEYFAESLKNLNLGLSVEIGELEKTYFKN